MEIDDFCFLPLLSSVGRCWTGPGRTWHRSRSTGVLSRDSLWRCPSLVYLLMIHDVECIPFFSFGSKTPKTEELSDAKMIQTCLLPTGCIKVCTKLEFLLWSDNVSHFVPISSWLLYFSYLLSMLFTNPHDTSWIFCIKVNRVVLSSCFTEGNFPWN